MMNSSASPISSGALPSLAAVEREIQRRERERERARVRNDGELIKDRCQTLVGFVREAWHVLEPAKPFVYGWHIGAICEHLEAVTAGHIIRLLINVPPGMMKSLGVSVLWPAWEWGPRGMPQMRYITSSYSEDYVKRDSRRMRDLVSSEWYQALWGDVIGSEPGHPLVRAGERSFANARTGSREGMPFQSLTGGRGDRVIIDDPHSTKTAESDAEREATNRIFRESVTTRLNDPATSAIVVIMQRLHENDVSGEIIERGGYEHLCLPMEFEPERCCSTSIGFTDPRKSEGELLFPERFPREVVDRDKAVMGSYATAGQFQQAPAPRKGGLFEVENMAILPAMPNDVVATVRYWDKAGTEDGGAYTAGVRMSRLRDGRFVVTDVRRGQWSAARREAAIKQAAETDPAGTVIWVEQEPGSGGKESAESTIRNLAGHTAKADRVSGQGSKETRAQPYSAQVEVGNVALLKADWNTAFIEEHRMFPRGKFKDQVDAAAGAFNKLAAGAADYSGVTLGGVPKQSVWR